MNEPEPIKYSLNKSTPKKYFSDVYTDKEILCVFTILLVLFAAIFPLIYVREALKQGHSSSFPVNVSYFEMVKISYYSLNGIVRFIIMLILGSICILATLANDLKMLNSTGLPRLFYFFIALSGTFIIEFFFQPYLGFPVIGYFYFITYYFLFFLLGRAILFGFTYKRRNEIKEVTLPLAPDVFQARETVMTAPEPVRTPLIDFLFSFVFSTTIFIAIFPVFYVYHATAHGYGAEFFSQYSYLEMLSLCYFSPGGMQRFTIILLLSLISFIFALQSKYKIGENENGGCLCFLAVVLLLATWFWIVDSNLEFLGTEKRPENMYSMLLFGFSALNMIIMDVLSNFMKDPNRDKA